jgi:hypothetical protein
VQGYQAPEVDSFYRKLVHACDRLVPFYRQYFPFYKMNKRIVVLDLLTRVRMYDFHLFQPLVR